MGITAERAFAISGMLIGGIFILAMLQPSIVSFSIPDSQNVDPSPSPQPLLSNYGDYLLFAVFFGLLLLAIHHFYTKHHQNI